MTEADEAARLAALYRLAILDTDPEPAFDALVRLAASAFSVRSALISFIDDRRQWFKARACFDGVQADRSITFCQHVLADPKTVMVVPDARLDARFRDSPSVTGEPFVRFYAGAPIVVDGLVMGTLCLIDQAPRDTFGPEQGTALLALSATIEELLRLRLETAARAAREAALDVASRKMALAEELSGVGHWSLEIDSRRVVWSDQVYRIHGVDPATFDPQLGEALDFYEPQSRARVEGHVTAAIETGRRFDIKAQLVRASDGSVRTVVSRAELTTPAEGGAAALVGVFQDVTEQEELLRQVQADRERYRLLAENANDMIALTSPADSTILFVSPGSARVLGYEPHELVGRATLELTHPDDRSRVIRHFRALLAAGPTEEVAAYQFRGLHKDGSWIWLEGQPRLQYDDDGEPVAFQDVVRDVSQRKRLESHLQSAREVAEAATRAKSDFLSNMSHELRTPLTGILGYADVLAEASELDAASRRHVELIRRSGRTLLEMVNDVLDLSKIEAGGIELSPRPTDLAALLQAAVDAVRPQAAAKGLTLNAELPPSPAHVCVDGDRLHQVVLNLLSNAIKFTDAGDVRLTLTVASTAHGRLAIEIAVSDTGIGIADDQLAKIFARFEQADASITRRFGGTGLGLSISREIVERMGGRLTARGEEGRGSVFTASLDLPEAAAPVQADPAAPRAARSELDGLKVLVAEDVAINRELISLFLTKHGVVLTSVGNGAEAVEAAARQAFDAVLMDMQMPVLDGLEATRRIRASGGPNAQTPILALTANVLPPQIAACRAAGMDDHVEKPFTAETLAAALQAAVAPPPSAAAAQRGRR